MREVVQWLTKWDMRIKEEVGDNRIPTLGYVLLALFYLAICVTIFVLGAKELGSALVTGGFAFAGIILAYHNITRQLASTWNLEKQNSNRKKRRFINAVLVHSERMFNALATRRGEVDRFISEIGSPAYFGHEDFVASQRFTIPDVLEAKWDEVGGIDRKGATNLYTVKYGLDRILELIDAFDKGKNVDTLKKLQVNLDHRMAELKKLHEWAAEAIEKDATTPKTDPISS